ncbi:MAG: hypothetical protein NVS2B8_08170 [Vulcanimicrobiaceae bacterium]
MDEGFVSLGTLVRAGRTKRRSVVVSADNVPPASGDAPGPSLAPTSVSAAVVAPEALAVVRDVRVARAEVIEELALLRLAAREAYERATIALLDVLARDVLRRELALAPAALAELVADVLATAASCEPVGIAVARADADVHAPLPVRIDDSLQAGDLVVEVRDGTLRSTFALRLNEALGEVAQAVRL